MKIKKNVAVFILLILVSTSLLSDIVVAKANTLITFKLLDGIIGEDTVLTKENSPYKITSTLQIADGATLSIEPGVEINDGKIEIFGSGKLVVVGSENEKALLNNILIDADNWCLASVNITHAKLQNVNYDSYVSGELIVKYSELNNCYLDIYEPKLNCLMEGNLFANNSRLEITSTDNETIIKNNTFKNENNLPDIVYNYTNKKTQKLKVEGNNFLVINKTVIKVLDVKSGDIINAQDNYWRTTDSKIIDKAIYDGNDDLNSNAIVEYWPLLEKYNLEAPIVEEPPLNIPEPSPEDDMITGVIRKNTVLTIEGSPYSINNRIQIADGATLTIEPGVEINNGKIEIFGSGKLVVVGSENEKALLNNILIDADNWCLASVNITHAKLQNVNYDSYVSGELIIKYSELNNCYLNIYEPKLNCLIEGNLFINNKSIKITSTDNETIIKNNTFKNENNLPDIVYNYTNQKKQKLKIEGNNFLVVNKTVIKIENVKSGDIIDAKNNYWGTSNTEIINKMIYDGNDDLNSLAYVDYNPILESFNLTAPSINEKPIINGADNITILIGQNFNEMEGVTAYDKEDGDLTEKITFFGEFNNNKVGEYKLIYKVTDLDGSITEVVRIIKVEYEKEDVNKDGVIDTLDLAFVGLIYNTTSNDDSWNADADINNDNIIDIFDLVIVSKKM